MNSTRALLDPYDLTGNALDLADMFLASSKGRQSATAARWQSMTKQKHCADNEYLPGDRGETGHWVNCNCGRRAEPRMAARRNMRFSQNRKLAGPVVLPALVATTNKSGRKL